MLIRLHYPTEDIYLEMLKMYKNLITDAFAYAYRYLINVIFFLHFSFDTIDLYFSYELLYKTK